MEAKQEPFKGQLHVFIVRSCSAIKYGKVEGSRYEEEQTLLRLKTTMVSGRKYDKSSHADIYALSIGCSVFPGKEQHGMANLARLAELLHARNTVESNIANLLGGSASLSTVGEYIAAHIFHITLVPSRQYEGIFADSALTGKTVDIQWYPRREGFLNIRSEASPDYFLVLAGPRQESSTARALVNPWLIQSVHLFYAADLFSALRERGVQIGSHTSVINQLWERAEIFPQPRNQTLILTEEQRQLLHLFA